MLGAYIESRRRYERFFTKFVGYLLREKENERAVKIHQFLQITGERWDLEVPEIEEILRGDYTKEVEEKLEAGIKRLEEELRATKEEREEREKKEREEKEREDREKDRLIPLLYL